MILKKWVLSNPPRLSLLFLCLMLVILITFEMFNYAIPFIARCLFWISVGMYIGVLWGIEAMKHYYNSNKKDNIQDEHILN